MCHISFLVLTPGYMFQSSADEDGCGFVRWVDPAPIHPHQEYIEYLQNRIFDLEMNIGDNGTEDDDNNNVVISQETICSDPYCNCPCHKKDGDLPPPSPQPPPPTTDAYYGEGATQYARWPHY